LSGKKKNTVSAKGGWGAARPGGAVKNRNDRLLSLSAVPCGVASYEKITTFRAKSQANLHKLSVNIHIFYEKI